ncbi:MAG: hypothetical protein ACMZ7B_11585 [Balneola sp.]
MKSGTVLGLSLKFFSIILWISLWSLSVVAQNVIVIKEEGIEIDIPAELRTQFLKNNVEPEVILKTWYSSKGFFNASIREISDDEYEVRKGCRFTIDVISVTGFDQFKFSGLEGELYSDYMLELEIDRMLDELESLGFLFANISIESLTPETNACEVEIVLEVDSGPTFLTSEILFPGARTNNAEYLARISGFRDSVLISQSLLDELHSNLQQSELFEEVAFPEVYVEESRAVIVIAVQERTLNQFDGLLGYVPDQNGNGQLVGDFELSLWNVLNQGNGIDLQYQRLRPETTRLNIGISQDWFGSIPVGLGFNFNLYQNDTTYQTRNLSLNSYYKINRGLKLTGEIGQVSSVSSNTTPLIREPDGKKRYGQLGFRYSTVNNIDVPTRGMALSLHFGASNKSVEIDSIAAFTQRFIQSEASYYIPVTSKNVIAFSAEAFLLDSDKITENDLIRFGGANSFRGYSEEQFFASRLIWTDLEYRFLVNRYSYLFLFGAIGSYHRPKLLTENDNSFKASDFLYSTGFGLSYKVRIGRIKFAYAISPEDGLGNGKVHLGIITRL